MEKDERMFKFAKVEEGLGFDKNCFDISFVFNQNGLRGLQGFLPTSHHKMTS
jgi:hypothetical protein